MPGYVRNRGKTTAGKTKWQARWRHPQDARKQVEKQGFDTKKRAEAWIDQQDADAWAGLWVDPHDSDRRFSEVVESWRETWMNLEPKTRAGYDNILAQRVLPVFGDRRIGQIDHDEVQRFINRIKDGADRPGRLHNVPRAPNTGAPRLHGAARSVRACRAPELPQDEPLRARHAALEAQGPPAHVVLGACRGARRGRGGAGALPRGGVRGRLD